MASEVYSSTTAPNPKTSWCLIPSEHLDQTRFVVKLTQVVLSAVAFLLEEVVSSCSSCFALYFFEFVTCTAFLFTLLLLILLSTSLHGTFGITCWPSLDFFYTAAVAVFFFVSSIVFASDNNGSTLEKCAVAFGFLAAVAFAVDVFLFYRGRGFPLLSGGKAESSNGGPVTVEAPAEKERLNADGE